MVARFGSMLGVKILLYFAKKEWCVLSSSSGPRSGSWVVRTYCIHYPGTPLHSNVARSQVQLVLTLCGLAYY